MALRSRNYVSRTYWGSHTRGCRGVGRRVRHCSAARGSACWPSLRLRAPRHGTLSVVPHRSTCSGMAALTRDLILQPPCLGGKGVARSARGEVPGAYALCRSMSVGSTRGRWRGCGPRRDVPCGTWRASWDLARARDLGEIPLDVIAHERARLHPRTAAGVLTVVGALQSHPADYCAARTRRWLARWAIAADAACSSTVGAWALPRSLTGKGYPHDGSAY